MKHESFAATEVTRFYDAENRVKLTVEVENTERAFRWRLLAEKGGKEYKTHVTSLYSAVTTLPVGKLTYGLVTPYYSPVLPEMVPFLVRPIAAEDTQRETPPAGEDDGPLSLDQQLENVWKEDRKF